MIDEAVECETAFAEDLLAGGVAGLTRVEMRQYLEYVADQRLLTLDLPALLSAHESVRVHGAAGRAGTHQLLRTPRLRLSGGVQGEVAFDHAF